MPVWLIRVSSANPPPLTRVYAPMKRKPILLLMIAVMACPLLIDAQNRRTRRSNSFNVDRDRPVTNCGDIRVTYDRRPAITEETEMTLPASQVSTLRAQASNSGIYLSGWDRNDYSVKTCKAVPDDDPNASGTLREITTSYANGLLTVNGPNDREWTASLIIMAPRLSALDLQSTNGPMQLRDVAGNIQVRASNGPVGLVNVGGSVQTTTTNGPISLRGASGDHRLTATNGPIHVGLSGAGWDGPGLEVSTRNGPLSLSIPDNYGSAIQIQVSEHSPVSCKAPACQAVTQSLRSPGIIRLGDGEPIVRLSTVNGPLSIQAARE